MVLGRSRISVQNGNIKPYFQLSDSCVPWTYAKTNRAIGCRSYIQRQFTFVRQMKEFLKVFSPYLHFVFRIVRFPCCNSDFSVFPGLKQPFHLESGRSAVFKHWGYTTLVSNCICFASCCSRGSTGVMIF